MTFYPGWDTQSPIPFVLMLLIKYEADLPCKNITYISTKSMGNGVSHPVFMLRAQCSLSQT